jgi:hypothetical protein
MKDKAKQAEMFIDHKAENEELKQAILSVPEFIAYPWDWKQCIFCNEKRGHTDKCIRARLEQEK